MPEVTLQVEAEPGLGDRAEVGYHMSMVLCPSQL